MESRKQFTSAQGLRIFMQCLLNLDPIDFATIAQLVAENHTSSFKSHSRGRICLKIISSLSILFENQIVWVASPHPSASPKLLQVSVGAGALEGRFSNRFENHTSIFKSYSRERNCLKINTSFSNLFENRIVCDAIPASLGLTNFAVLPYFHVQIWHFAANTSQ